MRTIDFSPLYRSSVGFDRLLTMVDTLASDANTTTFPPYNIEKTGENAYRITLAVAGFKEGDLDIEAKNNTLTIKGAQEDQQEDGVEVLHRGIASRAFERRFEMADYVEVKDASLENGLLHVELVRELPEAMKPRKISIGTNDQSASSKQIEGKKVN